MTARPTPHGGSTPTTPMWWPESSSDGGAHLGCLRSDDTVVARCGRVFTPERHLATGGLLYWREPVDSAHGCPSCAAARHH